MGHLELTKSKITILEFYATSQLPHSKFQKVIFELR
mgnify:CR=1 FL=1